MPAYVIGQIRIDDPDAYQDYLDGFERIFARFPGRLLVSSRQDTRVLEGDWALPRTVVLEFDSLDDAKAWYGDPEYQDLARIRWRTAATNLVLVDGAG